MGNHSSRSSNSEVFNDIREVRPGGPYIPRRPINDALYGFVQQLNGHGRQHDQPQLRHDE